MARKKKEEGSTGDGVLDLRHTGVTRLNIPPAGLTARGEILRDRKLKYAINPHLSPMPQFNGTVEMIISIRCFDQANNREIIV
jgi:hypothetical protein